MTKSKKILIAVIAAVVIIGAGAAVTGVLAGDYIVNRFMLLTKTEEEYFKWFADRNVERDVKTMKTVGKIGSFMEKLSNRTPENGNKSNYLERNVKLHVTEDFCDLFNLYTFKDEELKIRFYSNRTELEAELKPVYGGSELLTLKLAADPAAGKLMLAIPEYREDFVSFASLYDVKTVGGKTYGQIFEEALSSVYSEHSENTISSEELAGLYERYMSYLINSVDKVSINRDISKTIQGKDCRLNEVILDIDSSKLKEQLNGIIELMDEDGFLEGKAFKAADLRKLIEKLDRTDLKLSLYVSMKAELLGGKAELAVKATRITAELLPQDGHDKAFSLSLGVNSLKAAEIELTEDTDSNGIILGMSIVPEAFAKSFLADYGDLSLKLSVGFYGRSSEAKAALLQNNSEIAAITVNSEYDEKTGRLFEYPQNPEYDYRSITETDYIDINALIGFALDIRDKIDEQFVDDFLNRYIRMFLGSNADIETLRESYNMGVFNMLDMLGNSSYGLNLPDGTETGSTGEDSTESIREILEYADTTDAQYSEEDNTCPAQNTTDGTGDGVTDVQNDSDAMGSDTVNAGESEDNTGESLQEDAGDNSGIGESELAKLGIETKEVADYSVKTWSYPDKSDIYEYSHIGLAEYAIPGRYKELSYTVLPSKEITAEEFKKAKAEYLEALEGTVLVNQETAVVEDGDEIYIDIVPVLGNYVMTSYSFNDCYARIGDNLYGEGLDEKLLGMKVGESRDVEVTLNENYGDFAGFSGIFRVTLKKIDRYAKPEWTKEFICGCLGFESLDSCSDYIMVQLGGGNSATKDSIMYELTQTAMAGFGLKAVPDSVYTELMQENYGDIYDYSVLLGLKPEEYFESMGISTAEFAGQLKADADGMLKYYSFYAAIAREEKLSVTGEELTAELEILQDYYECKDFDELMAIQPLDTIIDYLIQDKVEELIYSSAKISYKN